jgi:hypothetical protein
MGRRTKNVRTRFHVNQLGFLGRLVSGVAVIAALATGASLAAPSAGAAVIQHPTSSAARMTEAVAFIRAHDKALAHASDKKIETLVLGMAKQVVNTQPAARTHIGADYLGVSKTGDTLWFNKGWVAALAVASTALIIASLVYVGVELSIAYEFVHTLVDVLWDAVWGQRCAWFTYNSPRSLGTYSC